jgi:hypothetical protein
MARMSGLQRSLLFCIYGAIKHNRLVVFDGSINKESHNRMQSIKVTFAGKEWIFR